MPYLGPRARPSRLITSSTWFIQLFSDLDRGLSVNRSSTSQRSKKDDLENYDHLNAHDTILAKSLFTYKTNKEAAKLPEISSNYTGREGKKVNQITNLSMNEKSNKTAHRNHSEKINQTNQRKSLSNVESILNSENKFENSGMTNDMKANKNKYISECSISQIIIPGIGSYSQIKSEKDGLCLWFIYKCKFHNFSLKYNAALQCQ